jgi:N-glycosylase/DNA lyase
MKELKQIYTSNKPMFEKRLVSFKKVWTQGNDLKIFAELCYCLCTAREKAKNALNVVDSLSENNYEILIHGDKKKVDKVLRENNIALHPDKADRIIINRKIFYPNTRNILQSKYCFDDIKKAREELVRDVVGFGFKEASHFLRNIGFGGNLAIIDRHIKNQLIKYGVIADDIKSTSITKKRYYEIEEKMIQFAHKIKIPVDILDMLLIYTENKEIIK